MNIDTLDRDRAAGRARQRRYRMQHPHVSTAPAFVALDGEGRNVAGVGSQHLYTLLAASDGRYVENVTDGLSTGACIDFLLNCKARNPHAVFVAFAFNYDVNMLLGSLSQRDITQLWQRGNVVWRSPNGGMYRITYVPSKFFGVSELRYDTELTYNARGAYYRKVAIAGRTIRVWDVWGFFQSSFVTALEKWLGDDTWTPATIDAIAAMKARRGSFHANDANDVRTYCLEECTMLVQMMDKLAASLWAVDLHLTSWLGAGAIASCMLKKHGIKDTLAWEAWPEATKDASMWAYFGGRVEIFQQGILPTTVYDYDIKSAYPAEIAGLPSLAGGVWWYWSDGTLPQEWGMVHVTWDTRAHKLAWLAPFPQHFTGGRVNWQAVGEGWYHVGEVRAALDVFGDAIVVHEAWEFVTNNHDSPFAFVREMFARKDEYKAASDPRYYPLKVGLNSLYGKLAQSMGRNEERRPPYQNFFLAGAVTAGTRARMLRGLAQAGREHAVMAATDGLFSTKQLNFHREAGHFHAASDLGAWEVSETPPGMVLVQAGVYWERPGEGRTVKTRTRGFGVKSVSYEQAASLFPHHSAPSETTYRETRFIGMGYCVGTGDWSAWRTWQEQERTLSRSLMPRRGYDAVRDSERQGWLLVVPGVRYDVAQRQAYKTRQERAKAPDADALDAIQQQEQPEGAGE